MERRLVTPLPRFARRMAARVLLININAKGLDDGCRLGPPAGSRA
jgi:hypothetical protein